jgi:membrane protein DedA with SNARE-associated domain
MDTLSDWLLTNMVTYGAPLLVLVSYLGSLGIPFPITLVIMAAGAFTREGILDWRLTVLACLAGAALADHSEFLLGRLAQTWLKRRFERKGAWQDAMQTFNHQGGWAILLTRFWLTPLAPAINVIAGSRYPYLRFLLFDLTGELLWVLLYGGLGYLFAAQWRLASQVMGQFSAASMLAVLAAVALAWWLKNKRKHLQHT